MADDTKTYPCVEVYARADSKWAWRLLARNKQVIATDGSQGYENKTDAVNMADRIVRQCEFKNVDIWRPKD